MSTLSFANNLKKFREQKGLSQEELGKRVGVSGTTIGYWEEGRHSPRMARVEKIAAVLEVKKEELMFDEIPVDIQGLLRTIKDLTPEKEKEKAIRIMLSLPDEDVRLITQLMERTKKED